MKFKYDKDEKDDMDMIAALYEFSGGPSLCLCIKTDHPRNYIWIYENDSVPTIQPIGFRDTNLSPPVKRFYKGDEITLKF